MGKLKIPYDVDGNPIGGEVFEGRIRTGEHHGCKDSYAVHNGSECSILQTDAQFLDNLFYSADGISFDAKSYEDYRAVPQWMYSMLLQWDFVNDICVLVQLAQYSQAYAPTPDDYVTGVGWAHKNTDQCDGGTLVPIEVVSGGIGPLGTWAEGKPAGTILLGNP